MQNDRASMEVTKGAPEVRRLDTGRFRVSDAFFSPGHVLPSHYHDRAVLSVVVEGCFVQSFPGRECSCPPGGVLVKPPGERHVDRWQAARSRHLIIEPDPQAHDELSQTGLFEQTRHMVDPGAEALALRLIHELGSDEPARRLAVEALALELVVRIQRGPAERNHPSDPPSWLRRIRELLQDRFRENLSLDELAEVAGVHRSHLSRTFSEYYPSGIADYVRDLKVEAVKRELAETADPIARIAIRNGFADQSHLTRTLKRATGLTPGRYRTVYRRL